MKMSRKDIISLTDREAIIKAFNIHIAWNGLSEIDNLSNNELKELGQKARSYLLALVIKNNQ